MGPARFNHEGGWDWTGGGEAGGRERWGKTFFCVARPGSPCQETEERQATPLTLPLALLPPREAQRLPIIIFSSLARFSTNFFVPFGFCKVNACPLGLHMGAASKYNVLLHAVDGFRNLTYFFFVSEIEFRLLGQKSRRSVSSFRIISLIFLSIFLPSEKVGIPRGIPYSPSPSINHYLHPIFSLPSRQGICRNFFYTRSFTFLFPFPM